MGDTNALVGTQCWLCRWSSPDHAVIAPERVSDLATGQAAVDGSNTASFVVQPGDEHWPTVVAAVSGFLRDRVRDADLVTDVEAVLSRVLWEFLRHSDSHGAVVELGIDDHNRVGVEVTAGQSAGGRDLLHALPPRSALTDEAADDDERARTQRTLDALSWSWGTQRQHRKTRLRFTVGPTSASPDERTRLIEPHRDQSIHAVHDRPDDGDDAKGFLRPQRPLDQVSELVVQALDLTSAMATASALERAETVADDVSTVARDAAVAASRAAYAADHARVDRATAAAEAARSIAVTAALTVRELRVQQDEQAAGVAAVAAAAAERARRSAILDGDIDEAAVVALRVASAVAVSAARAAEEATAAAVLVADAVTAAADAVAAATATAAHAAEIEVDHAASAMQAVTTAAAERRADLDARERNVVASRQHDTAATLRELMNTSGRLRDHLRRFNATTVHVERPMPGPLPAPDGLTVAVRPLGGLGSDYLGEHWYDVCVTPSRGTFLIVGSIAPVAGRTAAEVQRVRHLLLALVIAGEGPPAAAVAGLQRCVDVLGLETHTAVGIVHVLPPEHDSTNQRVVRWCGFDSPAPLVVDRTGVGVASSASGGGAGPGTLVDHRQRHLVERSFSVGSGSTVLLHSPGLLDGDAENDAVTPLGTVDLSATEGALDAVAGRVRWHRPGACGTLLAVTVQ